MDPVAEESLSNFYKNLCQAAESMGHEPFCTKAVWEFESHTGASMFNELEVITSDNNGGRYNTDATMAFPIQALCYTCGKKHNIETMPE